MTAATWPATARSRSSSTPSATSTGSSTWRTRSERDHPRRRDPHPQRLRHRRARPRRPHRRDLPGQRRRRGRLRPHPDRRRRRGRRSGRCGCGRSRPPGTPTTTCPTPCSTTSGTVAAVFTGGSMLYGTTGRTDLVSPDDTVELTHAQYHSVRRLVAELPGEAAVVPHPRVRQLLRQHPGLRGRRFHRGTGGHHQPGPDPGRAGLRRHPHRRARGLPDLLRPHGPGQRRRPVPGRPDATRAGRPRRAAPPPGSRAVGGRPA